MLDVGCSSLDHPSSVLRPPSSALASALPLVRPANTHVYAQYTIRMPKRDHLAAQLQAQGIPTGVYYPKCLHEQPVFADLGYQLGDFPVAEQASQEVLSLPMHPFLTDSDQDQIVEAIKESLSA